MQPNVAGRARSRHPPDKSFSLPIMGHRDPHRPVARPAGAVERALHVIEVEMLEVGSAH